MKKLISYAKIFMLLLIGFNAALMCLGGIPCLIVLLTMADFQSGKAIVVCISLFLITLFGFLSYKCFATVIKEKKSFSEKIDTLAKNASAQSDQNQVSEPNIVPMQAESTINYNKSSIVPTTSYTETENMLYRSDGKEISTDEIPYLVHVTCEEAIAKSKIPNTIHFILESYQLMYKTDDPETLCSRYNFASPRLKELTYYYHQGWYSDSAKISQYTNLFSAENYYKLIIQCYQRYLLKANQELKTKKGVENRINKFWNIIQSNVSAEVYKRLISQ